MSIRKENIFDEHETRSRIFSGVWKMAQLVGMTLGPAGKSVLIERGTAEPLIVDDGRRVAENIKFEDPVEQLATRILYGVTRKTDEKAGDGTTTSMILASAIIEEVQRDRLSTAGLLSSSVNVGDIDREIQEAKDEVIAKLEGMTKKIKTEQELIDVATVSVGDPKLGEIIGGMYYQMGKDGHIALEFNLLSEKIETDVVPGLRFSGGYADAFMITNELRKEAIMNDVHVLVTEQRDLDVSKVKPVASEVQNAGKSSLVIIAPKFTQDFLKAIYLTAMKSKFAVLCVRAPSMNLEHRKDIAIWTGGKFFSNKDDISQAKKEDLGYVEKIEVTDDTCILLNGKGNPEEIKNRIEEVRAEAEFEKLQQFKQQRLDRISALSGGVGVIRIGAPTDEERNWLKYKIEDAKYATKVAYQHGVVPGAGMAFKKISEELPESNILKKALLAPYNKLSELMGGKISGGKHIIDPVLVEKTALENACSAAAKLIRIGGVIANKLTPTIDEVFSGSKENGIIEDDEE